jgi:hypothetical protein
LKGRTFLKQSLSVADICSSYNFKIVKGRRLIQAERVAGIGYLHIYRFMVGKALPEISLEKLRLEAGGKY